MDTRSTTCARSHHTRIFCFWLHACVAYVVCATDELRNNRMRYIVRFHIPFFQADQAQILRNCSLRPGNRGWKYVYRDNPSAKLPSDIGVVASHMHLDSVRITLQCSPLVRDVYLDSALRIPTATDSSECGSILRSTWGIASRGFSEEQPVSCDYSPHNVSRRSTLEFSDTGLRGINPLEQVSQLHEKGITGSGIKVAIFDTGLSGAIERFGNVRERTSWTNEHTLEDDVGHGTFVAGVIGSQSVDCPGIAPHAELYIFRVFTRNQISYTSWFLDAFNYAIFLGIDILNLSIGGPDHADQPFVDKVKEVSASGIVVVSAIGNDGPVFGTLNNPADQEDTIGVGGLTLSGQIAQFSSRGMTLSQLHASGYGQVKPDIVTSAQSVRGPSINGGCRTLSGTSVASPLVAGAIALLMSSAKDRTLLNPAGVKQLLHESSVVSPAASVFEQGSGTLDIIAAYNQLQNFTQKVTIFPGSVSNLEHACPYMWPWCAQPLYHSGTPMVLNLTVLNGISVLSEIVDVNWYEETIEGTSETPILVVHVDHSRKLWPWSGWLSLSIAVSDSGKVFQGTLRCRCTITVRSVLPATVTSVQASVDVNVRVILTPPREQRILWDQYHSIHYPSAYVPRDALRGTQDTLDWNGDHLHTNFKPMFDMLRSYGLFVDILSTEWRCFDAGRYAVLVVADPEEDFSDQEAQKLYDDIAHNNLSLLVMMEWYHEATLQGLHFFDDNTRSRWYPITGGANVPSMNKVMAKFGVAFGDGILEGQLQFADGSVLEVASGVPISKWPAGGRVVRSNSMQLVHNPAKLRGSVKHAIIGLLETRKEFVEVESPRTTSTTAAGRIAVIGDASCMDAAARASRPFCSDVIGELLLYLVNGSLSTRLEESSELLSERLFEGESPIAPDSLRIPFASTAIGAELSDVEQRWLEWARYSKVIKTKDLPNDLLCTQQFEGSNWRQIS